MAKRLKISFAQIDQLVFSWVEKYEQSKFAQQLSELGDDLPQSLQQVIAQTVTPLALVVPFFIPLIVSVWTWKQSSSYENYIGLQQEIKQFYQNKQELNEKERKLLSPLGTITQASYNNLLKNALRSQKIPVTKVSISSFDEKSIGPMVKVSLELALSKIALNEFQSLHFFLLKEQDAMIDQVQLTKNPSTNLLDGKVNLVFYQLAETFNSDSVE